MNQLNMKKLNENQRGYLECLIDVKLTINEIKSRFNVKFDRRIGTKTIQRRKYPQYLLIQKQKRGRKSKTNPVLERKIANLITCNSKCSWFQIKLKIKRKLKISLSITTIRKICKRVGIKNYRRQRKPILTNLQIQSRKEYALKYINKPISFWRKVLFTDEKTITRQGKYECGNIYVKCFSNERYSNENIISQRKFCFDGIKYWGSIAYNGYGSLVPVERKFNSDKYINIVKNYLIPDMEKLGCTHIIQDGDPSHTCKKTLAFLRRNRVKVIKIPSSSPDTNIIENIWALWQKKVRNNTLTKHNLDEISKNEWGMMDPAILRSMVDTYKNRLKAIIEGEGRITKY